MIKITSTCGSLKHKHSSLSPHSLPVAAGLHDDAVGDGEEQQQDDLGERGHSEVGDDGEGAGHAGQQGVGHVGTRSVHRRAVGGLHDAQQVQRGDVVHQRAGVHPDFTPRNTSHLREGMKGFILTSKPRSTTALLVKISEIIQSNNFICEIIR